ncbi:MAG: MXAN_2562 family outer membrane beta-barrel protein [Myxococcales bacterium]
MRIASLLVLTLVSCFVSTTAFARAPDTFEENYTKPALIESPMWMALELKAGPYVPGDSSAIKDTFGGDKGWMLSTEVDFTLVHIPKVGQFNLGAGFGWASYKAKARDENGVKTSEETKLVLYPLSALAVLRIDALARETVIPLTFAGKIGFESVRWKSTTGDRTDASGFNNGLRWGAQAAFELDWFDRRAARRMDEEWGVNHTFLLFEYYDSMTKGTGDRTYQIGVGTQF